jgi:membrane protease YdiL (CAAX protease family)
MLAAIATGILVGWLLLGEPLLGRWSHRRLLAALDAGQTRARLGFYRSWIWQAWLLAGVTLLVVRANGWSLTSLGLRLPHAPEGAFAAAAFTSSVAGVVVGLVAGAVCGLLLARRKKVRGKTSTKPAIAGGDKVLRMLPHGRAERWSFAMLATTAGITEEWIWRGFGVAVLHVAWSDMPMLPLLVALALAFGWAHFYQGLLGMLATGLIGALLAWLYLASGSLLLPMLLHVLIDLRALLLSPRTNAVDPTIQLDPDHPIQRSTSTEKSS